MQVDAQYWSGDEWEDHVMRLLQDLHGAENVQPVPAKHKGDCGLDFMCLGKGIVYQCYSCDEPVDVQTRYEKQRDKITEDLGKFVDPSKGATTLLAGYEIKRWILVVPTHDSGDIVRHALKKALQVKTLNLAHVHQDFQVLVRDSGMFDEASLKRRMAARSKISITANEVTDEDIASLVRSDSSLEENLRSKLVARIARPEDMDGAVNTALRAFREAENAIESLKDTVPEVYEDVIRLRQERLRRLQFGPQTYGSDPFTFEMDDLKAKLMQAWPTLDAGLAETLCLGSVSGWLMLCPLRFH